MYFPDLLCIFGMSGPSGSFVWRFIVSLVVIRKEQKELQMFALCGYTAHAHGPTHTDPRTCTSVCAFILFSRRISRVVSPLLSRFLCVWGHHKFSISPSIRHKQDTLKTSHRWEASSWLRRQVSSLARHPKCFQEIIFTDNAHGTQVLFCSKTCVILVHLSIGYKCRNGCILIKPQTQYYQTNT